MRDTPSLLQVDRSLMQARWVLPPVQQDIVEQIARQHDLPEIIARLLNVREIPPGQIEAFLFPRLGRDFPDPMSLAGMEDAADTLADAVIHGRKLAVFGDFDVDGATSTAILVRFFRHFGMDIPFHVPDRIEEGYGPNIKALQALKDKGADLVILADCGISAFEVIEQARNIGLDIIVLDHHEAETNLPPANHIVNPKRKDDTSGLEMLAACGVAFLTCVAVNSSLRKKGYFGQAGRSEPPLKNWLDIVALGTVCDMVPLIGANRLFVRVGFAHMARMQNPGIKALCDVARVNGDPSAYHAGFVLGPRINAGSRVHQADLGARLLCTDNPEEARNIAFTLEDCNGKRKTIQQEMFDHALNLIESTGSQDAPVIIVGHESWHPGLSGLVAGRLKERYNKPSIVITYAPGAVGALEGRGSGRSVPGVNLGAIFIDARNQGLIIKGGGHAMAAGFTVLPDKLSAFNDFVTEHVTRQLAGQAVVTDTIIDGVLSVRGATPDFVRVIHDHVGPFGTDHSEPLFALSHVRLHMADIVGADHVRCTISDWEGGSRMKAMAFRAAGTPLGQALLKEAGDRPIHLAGHFKVDSWNGREQVELHIHDAALPLPRT